MHEAAYPPGMSASQQQIRRWGVVICTPALSLVAFLLAVDAMISDRLPLPGSPLVGAAMIFVLAVAGAAFTVIDITEHRLPNSLMLSSFAALLTCVLIGWSQEGDSVAVLRAAGGALGSFFAFLLLSMLRSGGMGGGDVKLAGLLGALTSWVSWESLAICFAAAFISAGVFALGGLALRRLRANQPVAFGPFLILGAWCGLLLR